MSLTGQENPETRERLLDAAGAVFAERGFQDATIREICQRANANVAAIHYHIGDKEQLYAEVLQHALKSAMKKHPVPAAEGLPANQLRAHIEALLLRIFDDGRPSWHGKLIAREMATPTKAMETVVAQIRINQQRLADIVRQLLPPGTEP